MKSIFLCSYFWQFFYFFLFSGNITLLFPHLNTYWVLFFSSVVQCLKTMIFSVLFLSPELFCALKMLSYHKMLWSDIQWNSALGLRSRVHIWPAEINHGVPWWTPEEIERPSEEDEAGRGVAWSFWAGKWNVMVCITVVYDYLRFDL